jgi:transposase
MGLDGLKAPFQIRGNVNGEMVEKYFKEYLVKELKPGQIVVLDNASYHKRKGIQKAVEEVGCKLLFLPAYSPDFNPIEQLWSQLKRLIKKSMRQVQKSVNAAIDWAFLEIIDSDFSSYFRHFQKTISASI